MNPTTSSSSSMTHSSTVSSSPGHPAVCAPHQRTTPGSSRIAFNGPRSRGAMGRRVTRSPWMRSTGRILAHTRETQIPPRHGKRSGSRRRPVPSRVERATTLRQDARIAHGSTRSPYGRAVRPFVLAFAFLVVAPSAVAARPRLTPPVPGTIMRGFAYGADPFARGLHRGIDLAAADGAPVRAACSGRIAFAGRAGANGRTVTIRCGAWSVTQLPLASLAVRAGEHIAAGAALGEAGAAAGHEGLHLGVRRADDRFGYVDPAPLLHTPAPHAPPAAPI